MSLEEIYEAPGSGGGEIARVRLCLFIPFNWPKLSEKVGVRLARPSVWTAMIGSTVLCQKRGVLAGISPQRRTTRR